LVPLLVDASCTFIFYLFILAALSLFFRYQEETKKYVHSMRIPSTSASALAAAFLLSSAALTTTTTVEASLAPWGKSIRAAKLFGLQQQHKSILGTRGGATKPAPVDEADTEEEIAPVELYLPGLLDAVVMKSDLVRNSFLSCQVALVVAISLLRRTANLVSIDAYLAHSLTHLLLHEFMHN